MTVHIDLKQFVKTSKLIYLKYFIEVIYEIKILSNYFLLPMATKIHQSWYKPGKLRVSCKRQEVVTP